MTSWNFLDKYDSFKLNFVYPTIFTIIDLVVVAMALFHVKHFRYGCHDAIWECKSENLVQILQYQVGAVTRIADIYIYCFIKGFLGNFKIRFCKTNLLDLNASQTNAKF